MLSIFEHHVEGSAVSGLEQAKGGEVVAFVESWSVWRIVRWTRWPWGSRAENAKRQEEGGSWKMHGEDKQSITRKIAVVLEREEAIVNVQDPAIYAIAGS